MEAQAKEGDGQDAEGCKRAPNGSRSNDVVLEPEAPGRTAYGSVCEDVYI